MYIKTPSPSEESCQSEQSRPKDLLLVNIVKQIKAAARAAEDGLAQRLPSAGKGFYEVFKKTKISLDFFGSFFYQ